ncbi:uncharacterized protein LOC125047843 [Penaeus chinensis]|uniref:uncharacterized protein LOC125047843 n=1 Tax=Penaeus chinensis TaxID=139456 RepID=UPI001FB81231|nr:uncharacterized protein LOC125047843 [Penaeus chinensis]
MSGAIMDDSGLEKKMFDSTCEFIPIKEENMRDIDEEDYQGVKEVVDDIDQDDTLYIKTEETKSLEKRSVGDYSNENIIYIKTAGKVDVKHENPLYKKFKIQGEEEADTDSDILMCEDIDPLSSALPYLDETCKSTCSLEGQVTQEKK